MFDFNPVVQVRINNPEFYKDISEDEILKRATPGSSGFDLRYCEANALHLWPNESKRVDTGLSIFIENPSIAGLIIPKSGKGSNGLVVGNLVGNLDSDYQGKIEVCLWNRTETMKVVVPGEFIAQLVFVPVVLPTFKYVDTFSEATERGNGGFGSTGG